MHYIPLQLFKMEATWIGGEGECCAFATPVGNSACWSKERWSRCHRDPRFRELHCRDCSARRHDILAHSADAPYDLIMAQGPQECCGGYICGSSAAPSSQSSSNMREGHNPRAIAPPPPASLQVEAAILSDWAIARGATDCQRRRILALLDFPWLRNLPLPPRTRRLPGVPDHTWHRFLIRRHIQHILRWTSRRSEGDPDGFTVVDDIIRGVLFPAPPQPPDVDAGGPSTTDRAAAGPRYRPERAPPSAGVRPEAAPDGPGGRGAPRPLPTEETCAATHPRGSAGGIATASSTPAFRGDRPQSPTGSCIST